MLFLGDALNIDGSWWFMNDVNQFQGPICIQYIIDSIHSCLGGRISIRVDLS